MKIDKLNGNEVSFESGAIENPTINKIIVDILEITHLFFSLFSLGIIHETGRNAIFSI